MKELTATLNDQIKTLGAEIRRVRIEKNMSQTQLADAVGVRQPVISRLEKGTHVPTWRNIDRVLAALDAKLTISVDASN